MKERFILLDIDDKYAISNLGIFKNVRTYNLLTQRVVNGYLTISTFINNKKQTLRIHRLVAMYFVPNPQNKPYVNHIDGNKLNNNANNLEWVTAQENNLHARKLGLINQNKPLLATNIETGEEIAFESLSECARFLNCNKAYVYRALNGISGRTQYKGFKFKYI